VALATFKQQKTRTSSLLHQACKKYEHQL